MTINEKLLLCSDVMDCASERTIENDLTGYQPIYKPWHLVQNGKKLCFDTQKAVAKYLEIGTTHLCASYNGENDWLERNGCTLTKLVRINGRVTVG